MENKRASKSSDIARFVAFLALLLFMHAIPFLLLRTGTSLPLWADILISIPTGPLLLFAGIKFMAD
jgi:hypothetical protein